MTTSSGRRHAGPGPASDQPPIPEPTFAERARTLVYLGRLGALSTLSRKQPGFPFGSVMPYGLDDHGRPIFLISTMAMHTQNLRPMPAPACWLRRRLRRRTGSAHRGSRWLGFHVRLKNARWHARCSHCILEGGKESGGNSESACGNGATVSFAGRMNF